jgi:hypothetical protein
MLKRLLQMIHAGCDELMGRGRHPDVDKVLARPALRRIGSRMLDCWITERLPFGNGMKAKAFAASMSPAKCFHRRYLQEKRDSAT